MNLDETKCHLELANYETQIRNRDLASLRLQTRVTSKVLSGNASAKSSAEMHLVPPLRPSSSTGHENRNLYCQSLPENALLQRQVSGNKNAINSLRSAETAYMLATGDIFVKPTDVFKANNPESNNISRLSKTFIESGEFQNDTASKQSVTIGNLLQDIAVTNTMPRTKQLVTPQIGMVDSHTDKIKYRQSYNGRNYSRNMMSAHGTFSRDLLSGKDGDFSIYSSNLHNQRVTPFSKYTFASRNDSKLSSHSEQGYGRLKGSSRRPPSASSYANSRVQNSYAHRKSNLSELPHERSLQITTSRTEEMLSAEESVPSISFRQKLKSSNGTSPILGVTKAIRQLGISETKMHASSVPQTDRMNFKHPDGKKRRPQTANSKNKKHLESSPSVSSPTSNGTGNSYSEIHSRPLAESPDLSENYNDEVSVHMQDNADNETLESDFGTEVPEESGCQDSYCLDEDDGNDIDCSDDTAISCLEDDNAAETEEIEMLDSVRTCNSTEGLEEETFIKPAMIDSLFSNCSSVINFGTKHEKVEQLPAHFRKLLRWKMSPITPIVVKHTVARSGFKPSKKHHDWVGYFGKHMKASGFRSLRQYQKVNHFPGSFQVGRKDRLWRNLSRMQAKFGKKEFGFIPHSYVLPWDKKLLKSAWEEGGSKQKYIIKPPASARGIGIRLVHKWNQIPTKKPVLVQKYLSRPLLLNGYKFDIRLYVYVTSFDPLRIYLFDDGLVRFATAKYSSSTKHLPNRYMHLTNYSINKHSGDFQQNDDVNICQGHKWSLKALWKFLQTEKGINTDKIWQQMKDIVTKTLISVEQFINSLVKANCRRRSCCHELFGFDIMLDDKYQPWILEVNISPSLHSNSPLDVEIKGQMVSDMFNLAGFQIPDKRELMINTQTTSNGIVSNSGSSFSQDKRKESLEITCDTRAKHTYFARHFKQFDEIELMMMMLDVLTVNDIQMLVESEDENSRRGRFERIFPGAEETRKYMHYFEQPRYNNILLHMWELKYQNQKQRGISLLETFCRRGLHLLGNSTQSTRSVPMEHVWTMSRTSKLFSSPRTDPKYLPLMIKSSASIPSLCSNTSSTSIVSLPRKLSSARKWNSVSTVTSVEAKLSARSVK
uniref:tubulin polyglutamylase TTLL4-like n=1 Tax=Styela clava TaxID=7725 RepID=UPI00193A4822|nr:tubulin polyglutamylase TTLL4-like [Styela clava]